MTSTLQGNYEMREYSTVSNCRQPHDRTGEEVKKADQSLPQLLHYQVDNELKNPVKKHEDKNTVDSQEEWSPSTIYAQVDKKKSKKKEKIPPQTPEPYTSLEQMYAQVDKKKKSPPKTSQPYTPLDQMYAHVDKKKSKKREVSEDLPCESGDVYSVVNKPSAPEIPQKSQLLLEELN